MEKLYRMNEAVKLLGISIRTLQRWDKENRIRVHRTAANQRRIPESEIKRILGEATVVPPTGRILILYARVSSHEQKKKGDLDRQVQYMKDQLDLTLYEKVIEIRDVGSGMSDSRKGYRRLRHLAKTRQITEVAVRFKDRLTRFNFELVEEFLESHNVKLRVLETENKEKSAQEELVEDLISIITSFSGKIHGQRGRKKDIEEKIKDVVFQDEKLSNEALGSSHSAWKHNLSTAGGSGEAL